MVVALQTEALAKYQPLFQVVQLVHLMLHHGSVLAIGAHANNGANGKACWGYKNMNGSRSQVGQDIDGENAGDAFDRNLALSNDESVLAVGVYLNDDNGSNPGHVRIS